MSRKTKALGVLVVIVLLLAAGFVYRVQRNAAKTVVNKRKAQSEQAQTVAVTVSPASLGDVSSVTELTGTLRPQAELNLVPKIPGRVTRVYVDVGDSVRAGQLLLEVDQSDLRVQVKQAEAAVAAAKARLEQLKAGARPEEVAQAEAAVTQARAGAEGAKRGLESARRMFEERTATSQALNAAQTQVEVGERQRQASDALVRQASIGLQSATDNLQRLTDLFAKGAVTRAQLEAAQTQADLAKAQLQSAEASREQATAALEGSRKNLATATETYANQTALQAQLDAAESQFRSAEANLKAAEARLAQVKAGARSEDVRAAEAAVAQAEAAAELAHSQLSNALLTAPAGGTVSARFLDPGELAAPGLPALTLVSTGAVFVEVSVTENLVDKVSNGLPVAVTVDALPGRTFQGSVTNLAPAADARSHAFSARVTLPNPGGSLRPGMFASARLVTDSHQHVLVIPAEAVLDRGGDQVVFVVEGGLAHERPVKTGLGDGYMVEITRGLTPGERVVVSGQNQLADGVAVSAQDGVK